MNKFINWVTQLFNTPVPNKVIQPSEVETMSDQPVEIPALDAAQPVVGDVAPEVAPVAVVTSPLDAEKSAFANFVAFVEHGIEKLGSEAEAELVALAKKYL